VRSAKATKKQNGKCYVLTPERYVGAEAEEEKEEGLDDKMLHLTAKWERQFAENAK
jgi:type I restriction enzyme M protein